MFVKSLLTILLTACGIETASPANSPTEYMPPEGSPPKDDEDTYFCCDSVDGKGNGSGEGCEEILHSVVGGCPNVLKCTKGYTKDDDGKVTCTGS